MEVFNEKAGIIRQAKRAYSRVGIACMLMMVVPNTLIGILTTVSLFFPNAEFFQSSFFEALTSGLSMYFIGVPLAYLTVLGIKPHKCQVQSITPKLFLVYMLISWFLMYSGGFITNIISSLFSLITGKEPNKLLETALDNMPIGIALLSTCIIAPIFEELVFRKLIIDRTHCFGEKVSIIISAAMFSLFHTNPEQFLYAFLLGLIFGYVYMRHKNIWHTILLHGAVNLLGGGIPVLLEHFTESTVLSVAVTAMFACITIILSVIGLILFIKKVHKIKLAPTEFELSNKEHAKAALLNGGMITFILIMLILTVMVVMMLM